MTGSDKDYIVDTRRLVKDLSGNRRTVKSIDLSTGSTRLESESIALQTDITLIGDGTDKIYERTGIDVTFDGRELLAQLLTGGSVAQLNDAKIGNGNKSNRRDVSSLDSVIQSADSISITIQNGEILVDADFNNIDGEVSELGVLADDGTLVQYDSF